ncbi:tetratricopeptide repeat protein [Vibrio injensis]|uniref:tetratricopeptide repeat protein n=1 Tax=Vibrio injensis TaxID=1307414 RepID=UPI0009331F77|nr:tetratricopeptide repeat protein [Vibrio injensis]
MNTIGIAIGATGLSLILIFIWMISLSIRKKRLEAEKKAREEAYRKTLERMREQEKKDRLFKAESGHVPTMLFLAKEAERNNLKEALFWYERAANFDNINGMYGVVRVCGKIREDVLIKEKTKFWQQFIRAVEGDLAAKLATGEALIYGRGTEVNVAKGVELIQEAAESQHIDAMLFMGDWCVSKDNLSPSPQDSFYWYSRAAEINSLEAMIKLGLNYLDGVGVVRDHAKGCYWLERAAEKGHPEAMYLAGKAWIEQGANGNEVAYIWLFLSAAFGHKPAISLRDQVGTKIGVDSVVELQFLAKPLQRKIATYAVSNHGIIRALNKFYKRSVPIPKKGEDIDQEARVEESKNEGGSQVNVLTDQLETESAPAPLDFSHSPIDKSPMDKPKVP